MLALGRNAPLIRFLFSALYWVYVVCLFISYASLLILFSSLFPYLSFLDPLRCQDGCRKRRLNLALVLCFFVVVDWWICAFVVLSLIFSIPSQEIGLGLNIKPQLTQSIIVICCCLLASQAACRWHCDDHTSHSDTQHWCMPWHHYVDSHTVTHRAAGQKIRNVNKIK